jgi:hypothetical protein
MPLYFTLIFDVKYQYQERKLVYLETGAAPCSVIEASVFENVWQAIIDQFPGQTIYISDPLPLPKNKKLQEKIVHEHDLIGKLLRHEITTGVFLFDTTIDSQTAYHFKRHHGLDNIHIINPNATLFCNNKMPFYDLCQRSQMPHPKTWFMSASTFAAQKNTIPTTLAHGWIIKPPDSAKGNGTAYVDNNKLPAVLAYLNDRTKKNPLENECRFTYFWGSQNEQQQRWPYLLQEMVSAKNKDNIETTFRIVVSITVNENGDISSFKNLGVIEKFPIIMKEKCSDSVISLTTEVAKEKNYTRPFIRVLKSSEATYQGIEKIVSADMKKFIPALITLNYSELWLSHVPDVTQTNDYLSYVMPRIERGNFNEHNNEAFFEKLKEIVLSGSDKNKSVLPYLFRNRYFGEKDKPLPDWARNEKFFQFIVYFILKETDEEQLAIIWGSANSCLEDKNLNESTYNHISHILTLANSKLSRIKPEIFSATSLPITTCYYGPYSYLGYFPQNPTPVQPTASKEFSNTKNQRLDL